MRLTTRDIRRAWAKTRYVGCGVSDCPSSSRGPVMFLVCNYYPPGNFLSEYPWIKGDPCETPWKDIQNCPKDRSYCFDDSLCGGCASSSLFTTG